MLFSVVQLIAGLAFCGITLTPANSIIIALGGVYTEYLGDSTQKMLDAFLNKLSDNKKYKEILASLKNNEIEQEQLEKIFNELGTDESANKFKKMLRLNKKSGKNVLFDLACQANFGVDIESYLLDSSKTYKDFYERDEKRAKIIAKLIDTTKELFIEDYFINKVGDETKVATLVITNTLESIFERKLSTFTDKLEKNIVDYMCSFVAENMSYSNGGFNTQLQHVNFGEKCFEKVYQEIYEETCPTCGCKGENYIFDKKSNTYNCLGCGSKFKKVDIINELNKKFESFAIIDDKEIVDGKFVSEKSFFGLVVDTHFILTKIAGKTKEISDDVKEALSILKEIKEEKKQSNKAFDDAIFNNNEIIGSIDENKYLKCFEIVDGVLVKFANSLNLMEIILPNTIEVIGEKAFEGDQVLSKIILPNTIREIGDFAFSNCVNLKEIEFSKNLKRIGRWAFFNCGFEILNLPNSLTVVCDCAFYGCKKLTSLTFPEDVQVIGLQVFKGCKSLKKVFIPKSFKGKTNGFKSENITKYIFVK